MTKLLGGLVMTAAALLSACDQGDRASCEAPRLIEMTASERATQITVADSCILHWSVKLAAAEGSVSDIAEAVLGGCRSKIRKIGELPERSGLVEYTSDERERVYRQAAMFQIARVRVGECPLGDPAG